MTASTHTLCASDFIDAADFGARPDTGDDAGSAIAAALQAAAARGVHHVRLGPGRFDLRQPLPDGSAWIHLRGLDGLVFSGSVDDQGRPATTLVRHLSTDPGQVFPPLLLASDCRGLCVRDLAFDNTPLRGSAGRVVEVAPNRITVEILPGHPAFDGMPRNWMGHFDPRARRLLKGRIGPVWKCAGRWRLHDRRSGSGVRASLDMGRDGGCRANVGDHLFWFFGHQDGHQVQALRCHNLLLENLRVDSATSFCFQMEQCNGLTARTIHAVPGEGRDALCGRDGFKIARCTGDILLEDVTIEGTNDDVVNIHGTFLIVTQRLDDHRVLFEPDSRVDATLPPGSTVAFMNGARIDVRARVLDARFDEASGGQVVTFESPLPAFVRPGVEASPDALIPRSVHIRRCTFRNICGAGVVLKAPNAVIEDCLFQDIDGIGVFMGATFGPRANHLLEPEPPSNVVVRGNTFDNCGSSPWWNGLGAAAAVVADVALREGVSMRRLRIIDNTFENLPRDGIVVRDAADVLIRGNHFDQAMPHRHRILIDPDTTEAVEVDQTPIARAGRLHDVDASLHHQR